jgi:hypothetical protein
VHRHTVRGASGGLLAVGGVRALGLGDDGWRAWRHRPRDRSHRRASGPAARMLDMIGEHAGTRPSERIMSHSAVPFLRALPTVCPAPSRERRLGRASIIKSLIIMARPERFELPTPRFVDWCLQPGRSAVTRSPEETPWQLNCHPTDYPTSCGSLSGRFW